MQVPQFIDNWKNESVEALSPWFLAEWFVVRACATTEEWGRPDTLFGDIAAAAERLPGTAPT